MAHRRLRWFCPTWSAVFEPKNKEGKFDILILKGQMQGPNLTILVEGKMESHRCHILNFKKVLTRLVATEGLHCSTCDALSNQANQPSIHLSSSLFFIYFQLVASLIEKQIECATWCTQYVHATPDKPSTQRHSSQCSLKLI